jgi:hypothetical protein
MSTIYSRLVQAMITFSILLVAFLGVAQAQVILDGDRVESIHNLEIAGTLYNVSFDQQFGSDIFIGDSAGASAAVDAINEVLNAGGHQYVDNIPQTDWPIYWVLTDIVNEISYAGCNIEISSECSPGWENLGVYTGIPYITVYFEKASLIVEIDVIPDSDTNDIDTTVDQYIPVVIKSTNIAAGDSINFDAVQVDVNSLRFGPAEADVGPIGWQWLLDADSDSDTDLIVTFNSFDSGIACEDTSLTVTGETYAGQPFTGEDIITTPVCPRCHP